MQNGHINRTKNRTFKQQYLSLFVAPLEGHQYPKNPTFSPSNFNAFHNSTELENRNFTIYMCPIFNRIQIKTLSMVKPGLRLIELCKRQCLVNIMVCAGVWQLIRCCKSLNVTEFFQTLRKGATHSIEKLFPGESEADVVFHHSNAQHIHF